MTDGSVDYYDDAGKIREHADLFGNSVYYSYLDSQADPGSALIEFMLDS